MKHNTKMKLCKCIVLAFNTALAPFGYFYVRVYDNLHTCPSEAPVKMFILFLEMPIAVIGLLCPTKKIRTSSLD